MPNGSSPAARQGLVARPEHHAIRLRPQSLPSALHSRTPRFPSHATQWYRCGKHTVSSVRLLVNTHVVRQATEEVELGFYPSQDLFVRHEEFDVARRPDVAYNGAAEMA